MKRIIFLLILALLTSCTSTSKEVDYSNLLQYKKPFLLPDNEPFRDVQSPSQQELMDAAIYQQPPSITTGVLTQEQALKDAEVLHDLMKLSYGFYPVYQEQFEQAFVNLSKDIESVQHHNISTFLILLRKHLNFEKNYHFMIEGHPGVVREPNFYNLKNPKESKTSDFDVPFLSEDGKIIYYEMNNLDSPSKTYESLEKAQTLIINNKDVLYVHSQAIGLENKDLNEFFEQAKNHKGIMILDLRENPGGNIVSPNQLVTKLTGQNNVYSFQGFIRSNPQENDFFSNQFITSSFGVYTEEGYFSYRPKSTVFHQEGLLIVLQNHRTASAAELLIDMLHHLDNTLFLGTPTSGALSSNMNIVPYFLPESGIMIHFGDSYTEFNPDYFKEGVGFMPDLFVLDKDISTIIQSIIETYSSK